MLKSMIVAGLLLVSQGAVQAQSLPAKYTAAGQINIAMFPAFPPLAYRDTNTGKMIGLDVELGDAIAADLGLKANWVDVTYESAITSLKTGRIDMALSMVDLPESRDAVGFIDYIQSGAQFFTLAAAKDTFKAAEELCGQNVGSSRRGPFQRETQRWSEANCVAKGKPAMNAVGTEGSPDARNQLKQGRLQGVVQSAESIPYTMTQEPGIYAVIGTPFTDSYIAIGFPKENPALYDAIKASLNRLIANGTYGGILTKYGLGDLKVAPRG